MAMLILREIPDNQAEAVFVDFFRRMPAVRELNHDPNWRDRTY
jgi:hypothetical protein